MAENLRVIEYRIPESFDGQTIGAFLRSRHYSRRIINHLKNISEENVFEPEVQAGAEQTGCSQNKRMSSEPYGILLDSRPARTIDRLAAGHKLTIRLLETEESPHVPESPIPLDILYEDEDLCVIHKPAGMPVHPSMGHSENTLGNALCYDTHHRLGFDRYVERIVNRLDRDTSGTVISAKNALSASVLGEAVGKGEIHRIYFAVCSGNLRQWDRALEWVSEETEEESDRAFRGLDRLCLEKLAECCPDISRRLENTETLPQSAATAGNLGEAKAAGKCGRLRLRISAPLGRKPGSVVERCVAPAGERAVTHLQMLYYDAARDCSVLLLKLETGRTHQIRVHLQYLGHPLPGDFLYNPDMRYIQRQALHALLLRFPQPVTGEELTVFAPLPEDMTMLLRPSETAAGR